MVAMETVQLMHIHAWHLNIKATVLLQQYEYGPNEFETYNVPHVQLLYVQCILPMQYYDVKMTLCNRVL